MLYRLSGLEDSYNFSSSTFALTGQTVLVSLPEGTPSVNNINFLGFTNIEYVRQYGSKHIPIDESYNNCFAGWGWSSNYVTSYKRNLVYTALYVDDAQLPILTSHKMTYNEVKRVTGSYTILNSNTTTFSQQVATYYSNTDNRVILIAYITDVEVNDVYYDYIVARYTTIKGASSSFTASFNISWNSFNTGYKDGVEHDITINAGTKIKFINSIIDDRLEPLFDNAEEIPPYSITVYNYEGNSVVAYRDSIPAIKQASIIRAGFTNTLTLTGVNDRSYIITWDSSDIEGKTLLGLSDVPLSNRASLYLNATTSVSWSGDLVFYEAYGTYRPPATTFDIDLYQNSAEVIRVDKSGYLTSYGTLSGALREESSMIRPTITFQSSSIPRFNYVYISAFRRYYYVNNIVSVNKNLWRMELNCDVLMTYKDEIADVRLALARQEFNNNPYLVDSEFPLRVGNYYEIVTLESTAFDTTSTTEGYNYVLTVIGA